MARRLLMARLGAMGDVIHALPAAAALRRAQPEIEIGWVIERRWAELLCAKDAPLAGRRDARRPLVDRVHLIDTFALRAAPVSGAAFRMLRALRGELGQADYELALDLQGSVKSAVVAKMAGARDGVCGFADPREGIARMLYRTKVRRRGAHVIEQNVAAMGEAFGMELRPGDTEELLPRDEAVTEWVERETARRGLGRFAILAPGAGWGAKQWPASRYGAVARELARDGIRSVINAGPKEEELAATVERESEGAAERMECLVGQLIGMTRRAALFIGGDTGPMHLANALGVPVVAIFGPTDPARNGPFFGRSVTLRGATSETSYSHRAERDPGLESVSVQDVVTAARKILGGR